MVSVLHFDVNWSEDYMVDKPPKIFIDVRLGARDNGTAEWTELAHSSEERELKCEIIKKEKVRT